MKDRDREREVCAWSAKGGQQYERRSGKVYIPRY